MMNNCMYIQKLDTFLEEYERKYGLEPLDNEAQINLSKSWLPVISSVRNGPYRKITAEVLKNFPILSTVPLAQKKETVPSEPKAKQTNEKPKLIRNLTWTKTKPQSINTEVDKNFNQASSSSSIGNVLQPPSPQKRVQEKSKQSLPATCHFSAKSKVGELNGMAFSTPESKSCLPSVTPSYSTPSKNTKFQKRPSSANLHSRIPVAIYYFKHVDSNSKISEKKNKNKTSSTELVRKKSSRIPIPVPKLKSNSSVKVTTVDKKKEVNKNNITKMKKQQQRTVHSASSSSLNSSGIRNSSKDKKKREDANNKSGRNDKSNKKEQQVHEAKEKGSAGIGVAEVVAIAPKLKLKGNKVSFQQTNQPQSHSVPPFVAAESAPQFHRDDNFNNKTNSLPSENPLLERGGGGDEISQCLDLIDGLCGHTSWVIKKVLEMPATDDEAHDILWKLKHSSEVGDFFGAPYVKKEAMERVFFSGGSTEEKSRCSQGGNLLLT